MDRPIRAKAPPVHNSGMFEPISLCLTLLLPLLAATPDERTILTDRPDPRPLPLPEESDSFGFVVFGDRTGGPAEGVAVLADAVDEVNWLGPDLVMTVGDLIQGYNGPEEWNEQMLEFRGVMEGLEMPWFPVAGNHDIYFRGPDRPAEEHEGRYERHFGPLWYAFEHKGCFFVVMYTDEPNPETGERNFSRADCQRVSPEQLAWLDGILTRASEAEHVFVFVHHPRWIGRNYGNDWDRIHERLVAAGNVSAVFGGHIHQMRYDPRDGIEYFALATVGGHQSGLAPSAGFLHQYHVVTVREEELSVVAYPVGGALDPRAITGQVNADVTRLTRELRPQFLTTPGLDAEGGGGGRVAFRLTNPLERQIEVEARLLTEDREWMLDIDHDHAVLDANATVEFELVARRFPSGFDRNLRIPRLHLAVDLLTDTHRFPLEPQQVEVPLAVELPLPEAPSTAGALDVSSGGHATVPSASISIPDGPLTLEAWVNARAFAARQGVVAKTENSEYGIFASDGRPDFSVHLDGSYVTVRPTDVTLPTDRWVHLAGVYDGSEVRLYVDGQLVGQAEASGRRTTNDFPLVIGGDVDANGRATSTLDGRIDGVRLSSVARYEGERFEPVRRLEADDHARLLLQMDTAFGPWLPDASGRAAHARLAGTARIVDTP